MEWTAPTLSMDKERLWRDESHPTHTCFPLKQRLQIRDTFLGLKDSPEKSPKPSTGSGMSRCFWEDKEHQRARERELSNMFASYCIIFSSSTDYRFLVHAITNSWGWGAPGNLIWINRVDLGLGC